MNKYKVYLYCLRIAIYTCLLWVAFPLVISQKEGFTYLYSVALSHFAAALICSCVGVVLLFIDVYQWLEGKVKGE